MVTNLNPKKTNHKILTRSRPLNIRNPNLPKNPIVPKSSRILHPNNSTSKIKQTTTLHHGIKLKPNKSKETLSSTNIDSNQILTQQATTNKYQSSKRKIDEVLPLQSYWRDDSTHVSFPLLIYASYFTSLYFFSSLLSFFYVLLYMMLCYVVVNKGNVRV